MLCLGIIWMGMNFVGFYGEELGIINSGAYVVENFRYYVVLGIS